MSGSSRDRLALILFGLKFSYETYEGGQRENMLNRHQRHAIKPNFVVLVIYLELQLLNKYNTYISMQRHCDCVLKVMSYIQN